MRKHYEANKIKYSLFLVFYFISAYLFAGNGKLTGRVAEESTGEPLPFANVRISHIILDDGEEVTISAQYGAATDIDGHFVILNVPPGNYVVSASMVGYATSTQKGVLVSSDRTIEINFTLTTASVDIEQVVVVAERKVIKADVSATQEIITAAEIEESPVLRVDEYLNQLKGIELTSDASGAGLSVRGGAIRETDIRMDGISLQDPRSENSYLGFNTATVEEYQVLTGGFEAKYGSIRSGLLNVVTKSGQRDRYTFSVKGNVTPAGQKRFFGTNPWSDESWIYRVFAGEYAMQGTVDNEDVPDELRYFTGWANPKIGGEAGAGLDSLQKLELWKKQHPQYPVANRPDYYIEGAVTGPIPGEAIPIWGDFAKRTTFMFGARYQDSQFAFPLGPRPNFNFVDWNSQLKLTTIFDNNMRLSVNGMVATINSVTGGRTASYSNSLVDEASSFSYLSSTEASVNQQARLINGDNITNIFNLSRLQFQEQKYIIGGFKLTHPLSDNAFYTVDFKVGHTYQELDPFSMDTSRADQYTYFTTADGKTKRYFVPNYGSPNGSTNHGLDLLSSYLVYGGLQRIDSSYSTVYSLSGDLTMQIGRHHQFGTGFTAKLSDIFVYSGTWYQSEKSFTPETWQYYKAQPLEAAFYAQDKIEFEGMVLNLGARLELFSANKKGFDVSLPLDEDYTKLISDVYDKLPGTAGSYERWAAFRDYLENPPGWPRTENKIQFKISPRLGVAFPISENSKMYFNYAHLFQRPAAAYMYNSKILSSSVALPTPGLDVPRTISYEFGYEQVLPWDILLNVSAYYKDVANTPLSRQYISYYGDSVTEYVPDAYSDTRGIELRLSKTAGPFITFNGMVEYIVSSYGQTGLSRVFENKLDARASDIRSAYVTTTEGRPNANLSFNFHTPQDFGGEFLGINWLGGLSLNLFFEWRDGGQQLYNPEETNAKDYIYIDRVNYWNTNLRASKAFTTEYGSFEFILTITNLFNNKFLETSNMSQKQYKEYKESLKLPFETGENHGNDKWGDYKADHINIGWWTAPLFLNPSRVTLGLKLNL